MSGIKISRTENENRFKKGMYPTEDDFANVFASYVHKDDMIPMSNVVIKENGESIEKIINAKADKETLETFIKEFDTVLETVRDAKTGEITKTVIQDLSKRIKDAEDDIADTSNTAEKNENAIAKILSILGKQDGETVSELAARFTALSGDYATVYAFISKVKAFLESADVADTTINRWQEIENFLQGITDTETLTGLLENLKTEIKNEIPKGNFLEQVADLDGYTDAEDGKIVQYIGQTNDKYKRGFMYERKGGSNNVFTLFPIAGQLCDGEINESDILGKAFTKSNKSIQLNFITKLGRRYYYSGELKVGTVLFGYDGNFKFHKVTRMEDGLGGVVYVWTTIDDSYSTLEKLNPTSTILSDSNYENGNILISELDYCRNEDFEHQLSDIPFNGFCFVNGKCIALYKITEGVVKKSNISSWQPIKVQNVID